MDGRPTWTDCDEAGDVVPNVLSPRDLVSRPDIMGETVPHRLIMDRLVCVLTLIMRPRFSTPPSEPSEC